MRARTVDSTVEWLLAELDALDDEHGPLEARGMFGGHGVFADDTMFAIVHGGRAFLKVDDETRPDFEAAGSEPFQPNAKQTLRTYYEVPADVLEDGDALREWAERAIGAALRSRR